MIAVEARRYPSMAAIVAGLGGNAEVIPMPIPLNCIDGFGEAYYGRPERMLDPGARLANSAWSFVDPSVGERFAAELSRDLADGSWDRRYGVPDARVLILKNLDHRGWHFATTGTGPKGRQIALNPSVALTFYWPALGRRVRLRGMALQAEVHERDADFRARAPGAKAMALVGRQSAVMRSRQELDDALAREYRRLQGKPELVAPSWALFIVMPHEVEFWQGDSERRHDRLRYKREKAGWIREQLWP